MKLRHFIIALVALVLFNVLVQWCFFRVDLTEDRRYSLSQPTKELLGGLSAPIHVELLLEGNLNASFLQLQTAAKDFLEEVRVYGDVSYEVRNPEDEKLPESIRPIVIHERAQSGQMVQTMVYPYAIVHYQNRSTVVPLLKNERGKSGEENINSSVEQLEFAFAEAFYNLQNTSKSAVAFLEGHDELPEPNVLDLEQQLATYFQVDRGALSDDASALDAYKVVIIADPQLPFSERDKYILDQYLMRGGRILWAVNGVRFSGDYLATEGFTPVVAHELNLQDMLFRYGVRIAPVLLQDQQCLPIPVDVSQDPNNPNFQPIPWTYAPLLLTSQASPISSGLGQVTSMFSSVLEFVGAEDNINKEPLLATSSHSALTATPAEVDLSNLNPNEEAFQFQYLPVGALLEGCFPSVFAHRMRPDSLIHAQAIIPKSVPTKQIVIASGSVLRNELQQNQPLPLGYDRYTGMQFANRDFMVNAVLYLADDKGLLNLRQKTVTLRLLNDKKAHDNRVLIQAITIGLPLLLLGIFATAFFLLRKRRYAH